MRLHHGLMVVACGLVFLGCPKKESDEPVPMPSATQTATAAPTTSELQMPASPAAAVKAELDNRADGITGVDVIVAGAKAIVHAPATWKLTKTADAQVAASADQKAQLAYAGFGPEGAAAKLDKAAAASGLTGCQWAGTDSASVGKDKLPAQVADGACTRGGAPAKAAYMATEGLLVVGSWNDGGDRANVFGAMRSVTKAGAGGVDPIAACCNAISQNAKSAPPQQVPYYMTALGVCNGLKGNPQGRAMLGSVRAALGPAAVPAGCK